MKFAPETYFIQVIQVDIFADKDITYRSILWIVQPETRVGEMCSFGAFEIHG